MKSFYYQVIPLVKISLNKNPHFTYKSNEEIPFGTLVLIPFGRKNVKGIVFKKNKKPAFRTKSILEIKTPELIDAKQIALAEKISSYYYSPLGVVLKFFVFNLTKKIPEIKQEKIFPDEKIVLTKNQEKAIKEILKNETKKNLVFGPSSSGKTEIAMALIKRKLKEKKQALIVLPEIFLSYQEIYRYQKRFFKKKVVLLHSKLKPSEISAIWKNLKNGKIDILISTKIGCFMPFKNLGLIVVDEEQDISHKNWDQNPKYHVEKISAWLSEQTKSQLVFLSATPSIKNYWKAKEKKDNWNLIELPNLKTPKIKIVKPEIKIIDLWEKPYQKQGNIIFSKELVEDFKKTIQKKKIALILVPYHGKSQAVFCENCKSSLKCPKCETSLFHVKDEYRCLHCNHKISSLNSCPSCKSYKLKNVGFGTESVASELKKIFPQTKLEIVERSNFEKNQNREKLFNKIRENKINFLVGNQTIAKGFDFPNIDLVAILNAQRWTGKSDFKFDERWLGGFFQVGGRLNRPKSDQKGTLYIQTFKSNLEILSHLKKWKWEDFVENELKTRKVLKYPPYNRIFKISIRDFNKNKVEKISNKVYNQLQNQFENASFQIFEPYYGFVKKKGIFWNKNILIKIQSNKNFPDLEKKFREISNNWSIDPDSENLF